MVAIELEQGRDKQGKVSRVIEAVKSGLGSMPYYVDGSPFRIVSSPLELVFQQQARERALDDILTETV